MEQHWRHSDDALVSRLRRLRLPEPSTAEYAALRQAALRAAPGRASTWAELFFARWQPSLLYPAAALLLFGGAIWLSQAFFPEPTHPLQLGVQTYLSQDLLEVVEPLPYLSGDYRQVEDYLTAEEEQQLINAGESEADEEGFVPASMSEPSPPERSNS